MSKDSADRTDRRLDIRFVLSADLGEDMGQYLTHVHKCLRPNRGQVEEVTIENVWSLDSLSFSAFDRLEIADFVVIFAEQVNHVGGLLECLVTGDGSRLVGVMNPAAGG